MSNATTLVHIEMASVPTADIAGSLVISTGPLTQSTVLSDTTTLSHSPIENPDGFLLPGNDKTETVGSILAEEGTANLECITARANHRYDQPAGRWKESNSSHSGEHSTSGTPLLPPQKKRLSSGTFRYKEGKLVGYGATNAWSRHVAPDGKVFFTSEDRDVVFITDTYLCQLVRLKWIERWKETLGRIIRAQRLTKDINCPDKWEVFLRVDATGESCQYYMIDHDLGQIFWAHEIDRCDIGLDDDVPDSGLALYLHTEYWAHLEAFAHFLPSCAEENLRGMLIYADLDVTTAPGSTSMYSPAQCSKFLRNLDLLSKSPTDMFVKNHFIARLTKTFYHNRFLTYHGEEGARLDRGQRSHDPSSDMTITAVRLLLFALRLTVFGMDMRQLNKIEEVVVDDVVLAHVWQSFLAGFTRSVQQSNIVAAIIFSANIGFLAISNLTQLQSASSLVSTLFSLASLMIGLHHVRQHNLLLDSDAYIGTRYLQRSNYPRLGGYRLLAFFHCLPPALLLWSILTFCVTIEVLAFGALFRSIGWWIFLATGILQILLVGATVWFFWQIWEPSAPEKNRPWIMEGLSSFGRELDSLGYTVSGPPAQAQRAGPALGDNSV